MIQNYLVEIATAISLISILMLLFSRKLHHNLYWRAMSIPLSSIIGSGFIIMSPLLWMLVGKWSVLVLMGIIILSYQIGDVLRFNIQHVEPMIAQKDTPMFFKGLASVSYFSLGLSYLVSIAFYIHLLSAFFLSLFGVTAEIAKDLLSSSILIMIGLLGYLRGITHLEFIGRIAVNVKIALILSLCFGVFAYVWYHQGFQYATQPVCPGLTFTSLKKIAGILLLIQGFEISRYLGHQYSGPVRIESMKYAQIFSSLVYIFFVWCMMFVLGHVTTVTETTLIQALSGVSPLLALVLLGGGIFSQFSSALADTTGCNGILLESLKNKLSMRHGYIVLTCVSLIIIWSTNVLENITLASRLFSFYYFLQTLEALYVLIKQPQKQWLHIVRFILVSFAMMFVFLCAQSSG
ncbi:MAG: hypothetical protein Q8K36_00125 [Alphaproteobacteria bacterium]|nr:hypothetical protein [Alphaproteobacteria bacterium]